MNDFYIYLPSNTEFLPTNKSNKYVTKLAKDISLSDKWEVCLKEIHYPRSWSTLTPYECNFVIMREETDSWREITIESGYYKTARALVNTINKAISEPDVSLSFTQSSQRLHLEIPAGCSLHFSEPLSTMLGLGYGRVACNESTLRGRFPINLSRGIDSLYVYSDVVQTKLVGNTSVPLLGIVPISGSHGHMTYKEYSTPVYSDLAKNVFSTIEIYIMDSAGRSIPFEFGKVTVLLHFRKKE